MVNEYIDMQIERQGWLGRTDANGNTVYLAPVDLVGEEVPPYLTFRYVAVEVYSPPINVPGLATLTILGELNPNTVDRIDIPIEFQNSYNVRYTTTGMLWKMGEMFQLSIELYDNKESKVVWSDQWQEHWDNLPDLKANISTSGISAKKMVSPFTTLKSAIITFSCPYISALKTLINRIISTPLISG